MLYSVVTQRAVAKDLAAEVNKAEVPTNAQGLLAVIEEGIYIQEVRWVLYHHIYLWY